MTNLEHYKRKISNRWMEYVKLRGQEKYSEYLGLAITDVFKEDLKRLGFDKAAPSVSEVMYWLTRDYQEPIKLKQWEKEMLSFYSGEQGFNETVFAKKLKDRGYFNGVTDTSMTVREILDNCEVVE